MREKGLCKGAIVLTELLRFTETEITTVVENINIEIQWASLLLSSRMPCFSCESNKFN